MKLYYFVVFFGTACCANQKLTRGCCKSFQAEVPPILNDKIKSTQKESNPDRHCDDESR